MRNMLVLLVMLLSIGNTAHSAELFATVDSLSGTASVSGDSIRSTAISVGQKIYEKQTITTAPDSEVHLETVDGGIIAIRPNTAFRVDEYKADGSPDDKVFMSLLKGAIRSITGWIGKYNAPGYRITTPTATIGIRGTDHETTVIDEGNGDEPGTYDMVNEGVTVLKTQYGEREVTPEMFAFAPKYRAVAPMFLTQKPNFWAKRKLIIEDIIPQRKALLRDRINQLRDDRIKHLEKNLDKRTGQTKGMAPAREARKELRANQRKQAEQRRDVLRKEKKRNATQSGGYEKAERIKREQRLRPDHKNKN